MKLNPIRPRYPKAAAAKLPEVMKPATGVVLRAARAQHLRFSWDQKREIEETLNQAYLQMEGIHCVG